MATVFLNDMHFIDVQEMVWRQIQTDDVLGSLPSPRKSLGMVAISDKIIVYGGTGNTGKFILYHVGYILLSLMPLLFYADISVN